MTHTSAKYNLIFGKMSSADFYPEGRNNEIDVIVAAPKDTKIYPGEVVIMDKNIYSELLEALKAAQELLEFVSQQVSSTEYHMEEKQQKLPYSLQMMFDSVRDGRFASYRDQFETAINKAAGK